MEGYSLDLRGRVVDARLEADETIEQTAERFSVSVSFVVKLMARFRGTGSFAAKPHAGGFASALDGPASALLRRAIKERPDATLAELAGRLRDERGVTLGVSAVCRAVRRLRLPLKKSRSTTRPGTRRGSAGCAGPTPGRSARSRRRGASTWTRSGPPRA